MSSPDLKDIIAQYIRDVAANPRTPQLTERKAMNLGEQAQENVRWGVATIADLEQHHASSPDVQATKRDDLRPGDRGEDVARMQSQLARQGFDNMVADGVFGPRTLAAVREFQKRKKLEADGIVGPRTRQALQA